MRPFTEFNLSKKVKITTSRGFFAKYANLIPAGCSFIVYCY